MVVRDLIGPITNKHVKNIVRKLLACLGLLVALPALGQTPTKQVALLGKARTDALELRWAPQSFRAWQAGNRYGYTVLRYTWKRDQTRLNKQERRQLTPAPLRPQPQSAFATAAKTDKYAQATMGLLYDNDPPSADSVEQKSQEQARFAFSLFCADMSPGTAELSGLRLVDRDVKSNEQYIYKVFIAYPAPAKPDTASLTLDLGTPDRATPPQLTKIDFIDAIVSLNWDAGQPGMYSAFTLERSDDYGATFRRLNKEPILPTADSPTDNSVATRDSITTLYKKYRYRVRGITPFGDQGPPSEGREVYAYQTHLPPPLNPKYTLFADNIVNISWEYPDSLLQNLTGFKLLKTEDIRQPASLTVHQGLLPTTSRNQLDKMSWNFNYYQVVALDLGGRELRSEPVFIEVADSIPPTAPARVKAKADKKGIVRIAWKPSPEKDLYGYSVYRGNEQRNLLQLQSKTMLTDTVFTDTIPLHSTNKYVYYAVVASDNHLNVSRHNDTLAVKRPDIIPPMAPRFGTVSVTDSLVRLDWTPSISNDVVGYVLLKATWPDTTLRQVAQFDTTGLLTCYEDRLVTEGTSYRYQLEAIDDGDLRSGADCRISIRVPVPKVRGPVRPFTYQLLDKEARRIQLHWQYRAKQPVRYYTLYRRRQPDGPLDYYKRLDATTTLEEVVPADATYSYAIQATLTDESTSAMSPH
jgi:hypothetical protein